MVYIIKDYGKKKIQEKAIDEILERVVGSSNRKPKYDEVMEKVKGQQRRMMEVLEEMGIKGVKKVELRSVSDLEKVEKPISEQGSLAIDKSKLVDSYIDVRVNPDNYNDVKVGAIKKK